MLGILIMKTIKRISTVFKSERGASMLEYALLASLISVVVIAAVTALGNQSKETFLVVNQAMAGGVQNATNTPD